ncbi:MAG: hypothetical protein JW908_08990 [Anaerolineales bacterium]|nr:hypothetical protein [Anaerolineales bacterium]
MSSITYNITYLKASLEELERYLHSSDVYGQLHTRAPAGEPPFASLTLGNVLLARKELQSYTMDTDRVLEFRELDTRLETIRSRWRAGWEEKARQEYPARIRQWTHFLEDYRREPGRHADRYPYEVRQKVIMDLLGEEAPGVVEEYQDKLIVLDAWLKVDFVAGEFAWDEGMSGGFPRDVFWYIWGRVRGN